MDEEKAKVLNAFFVSIFNCKISCSPGTQPLNWKTGMKQSEAPITQGEMVSDLLLRHTQIYEAGWDHPRVLRELVEVPTEPLSIFYQQYGWYTNKLMVSWRYTFDVLLVHFKILSHFNQSEQKCVAPGR